MARWVAKTMWYVDFDCSNDLVKKTTLAPHLDIKIMQGGWQVGKFGNLFKKFLFILIIVVFLCISLAEKKIDRNVVPYLYLWMYVFEYCSQICLCQYYYYENNVYTEYIIHHTLCQTLGWILFISTKLILQLNSRRSLAPLVYYQQVCPVICSLTSD